MNVYTDSIRNLPIEDKLLLVEQIWDDLASAGTPLPLPDWAVTEAVRRRDEMVTNPKLGSTHDEVWARINELRNG
ncbi:MAG: addiction module protein [Pirellulaceae bacterium]|jgi:putative addiction module component (TIGR02574 family)|nr:addiction module protein [Pirellulaceae bacterium]